MSTFGKNLQTARETLDSIQRQHMETGDISEFLILSVTADKKVRITGACSLATITAVYESMLEMQGVTLMEQALAREITRQRSGS